MVLRSTLLLVAACGAWACQGPAPKPQASPAPTAAPRPPAPAPEATALFEEAVALRAAGDDAAARTKLDEALATTPTFALAALERASLLVDSGAEPELAVQDAKVAAAGLPDNPRAQRVLGQALEETGDAEGASEAYRRSLALRDDSTLRRRLAALEKRLGREGEALELWEGIRDEAPKDVGARLELAELYEAQGRPASAQAEWEQVVGLVPGNAHLLRRFAGFLERQGKLAEARAVTAKADELDPPREERDMRPLLPSKR